MADTSAALKWLQANPADPKAPAVRAKLQAMGVSFSPAQMQNTGDPNVVQHPPEGRGNLKYVDAVSDALPSTGALVGGALATPPAVASGGLGLPLIPAAGAAGYGGGEFLKRLIDKATGRPGMAPPVNVPASAAKGATEGMNAFSIGGLLGKWADANKMAESVYSGLKGGPTPYAPLGAGTLDALGSKINPPDATGPARDIVASPPIGQAAQSGAKYATPRVAAASKVGAKTLSNLGDTAADDAALFQRGARAEYAIPKIEGQMRENVGPLADKSGVALDEVRRAIGPYKTPNGMKLPGEDVVNAGFNSPASQNKVISDPGAMNALADLKSLGLRNKVYGKVLSQEHAALAKAESSGLTPGLAAERSTDADTLQGLAESLQRQRGGVAQRTPEGFSRKLYEDVKQGVAGPESMKLGFRGETPENAVLQNSRRLMEIERMRRGLPPLDNQARTEAMQGMERPAMRALASPAGSALAGGEFEAIRRLLGGDQ